MEVPHCQYMPLLFFRVRETSVCSSALNLTYFSIYSSGLVPRTGTTVLVLLVQALTSLNLQHPPQCTGSELSFACNFHSITDNERFNRKIPFFLNTMSLLLWIIHRPQCQQLYGLLSSCCEDFWWTVLINQFYFPIICGHPTLILKIIKIIANQPIHPLKKKPSCGVSNPLCRKVLKR